MPPPARGCPRRGWGSPVCYRPVFLMSDCHRRDFVAVAAGSILAERNILKCHAGRGNECCARKEYSRLCPWAQHLIESLCLFQRRNPAEYHSHSVVDAVHQHGQLEGTCLIIYISEKHSEQEGRKSLPWIHVKYGKEDRRYQDCRNRTCLLKKASQNKSSA